MMPSAGPNYSHRMVLCYHEIFGQWYVPNLRAYVRHERGYFVVKTNRYGMRSLRDDAHHPPSGWRRILVLGDSFTAGWGVNNEERFSDQLERRLERTEVLNFGLDGSGFDQQGLTFEHLASRFGGDLILWCPLVENIRRVTLRYWMAVDRITGQRVLAAKPYAVLEGGSLRFHHLPVPRTRPDAIQADREARMVELANGRVGWPRRTAQRAVAPLRWMAGRAGWSQVFPEYDDPRSTAWRLTEAIMERLLALAGGRLVVLAPLPTYHYIEALSPPTYLERFRAFVQRHPAVTLLDVLPALRALSPSQRRRCRYRHDIHYTPLAHTVVAEALSRSLQRIMPPAAEAAPLEAVHG